MAHVPRSFRAAAPLPRSRRITLTLVCRRTPAHDHARLIAAVAATPPHRRRTYDHAAALATFGAHPAELRQVCRAAESLGFTILERDARTRLVTISGTVATVERAFGVELALLDVGGQRRRAHAAPYTIPAAMAALVEAVVGLDEVPIARPALAVRARMPAPALVPQALMEHYRFPAATGTGERIALLQLGGGFTPADLRSYYTRLGLKRAMPASQGPNRPVAAATLRQLVAWMNGTGPHSAGLDSPAARWTFETTMDIEIASAFAPGAAIDVHFAAGDSAAGVVNALRRVVHGRRRPTVLSCSWALDGADGPAAGSRPHGQKSPQVLLEDALHEAAALGITVCAASGDDGSTTNGAKGGRLGVVYPASSAYVLAVGGTTVHVAGGRAESERVWNAKEAGMAFASGGGLALLPKGVTTGPPAWQKATLARWLAGHPAGAVPLATIARGVPDVAADADFNSGCLLIVAGIDTRAGGTSAAAPLWAALVARLNSGLRGKAGHGHRLGLLAPTLYTPAVAKTFTSVRSGQNNLRTASGPYHAARGWDPCTGLGVPNGEKLLAVLQAAASE